MKGHPLCICRIYVWVFFVKQLGHVTLIDLMSALRCQLCKPKVWGRADWLKMPQWKIQTVVWWGLCLVWNTRQVVRQLGPLQIKVFWLCHQCDRIVSAQDFKPKTKEVSFVLEGYITRNWQLTHLLLTLPRWRLLWHFYLFIVTLL